MRLLRPASAKSFLRFQDLSGREPALIFIRGRHSIGPIGKGVA